MNRPHDPFGTTDSVPDLEANRPPRTTEHVPGTAIGAEPGRGPAPGSVPGYEILGELGRGGMGVVYKARHLTLKRTVALKMVLTAGHAGPRELARFRIEAEAVARLQHPNIVQIHEVGEAGEHPYCALEFVEGGNLAGKLGGKPMPAREAAKLVESLARAMQLAHSRNVVHRDLKPANILLTADGTPKITDFGLARQTDSDSGETQVGAVVGTPSYMAPEQASGHAHEAGPAADVYALGAILYDCLTGQPPFKGRTVVETLDQVRTQEPVPPSRRQKSVPLDLETICLKCLRKEPEGRYASAEGLAEDLRRWQIGEPIAARPAGSLERVVKWVRRRPTMAALVGACLVALLALGGAVVGAVYNSRLEQARQAEVEQGKLTQEALGRAETYLYYHRIGLAERSWRENQVARAIELLAECPEAQRGWEWHYLDRLCNKARLRLTGHDDEVTGVAYSPDGKLLVTACKDQRLRLWEANTGRLLYTLTDLKGHAWDVRFSHNGRFIAASAGSGQPGGEVGVWTLRQSEPEGVRLEQSWRKSGECGEYSRLAFSPDDRTLAVAGGMVAGQTGELRVFTVGDGEFLWKMSPPQGHFFCVAFSPDGKRLAAGTGNSNGSTDRQSGGIIVWDVASGKEGKELRRWPTHGSATLGLSYSSDGRLASSGTDRTVRIWEASTFQEQGVLRGHGGDVFGIAFGSDGKQLASVSFDASLRIWDVEAARELSVFRGHSSDMYGVAWHPNGQEVATGGMDRTARIWDVRDSPEAVTLRGHESGVRDVAFHPEGKLLASAGRDGTARLWDLESKAVVRVLRHDQPVWGLAFSPDGRLLATAAGDWEKLEQKGQVRVWDVATGKEVKRLHAHIGLVWKVAFSPDGTLLASAGGELFSRGEIKLWDVATWTESRTLDCERGVHDIAFSPDGKRLAGAITCLEAYTIWALDGGTDATQISITGSRAWCLTFDREGRHLITGHSNGSFGVWNVATGSGQQVRGHSSDVLAIGMAPNRRRLVTASFEMTLKVWDAETRQELLTLRGHDNIVQGVAFSRDGMRIASCSDDGTIKLWNGRPR